MPHVVLIAQGDQVPGAGFHRTEEVVAVADTLLIGHDHDIEGRATREPPRDLDGVVRGPVVGDDEFIWRPCLLGDALQLLGDEALAIPGRHGHRDAHLVGARYSGTGCLLLLHPRASSRDHPLTITRLRSGLDPLRRTLPD